MNKVLEDDQEFAKLTEEEKHVHPCGLPLQSIPTELSRPWAAQSHSVRLNQEWGKKKCWRLRLERSEVTSL